MPGGRPVTPKVLDEMAARAEEAAAGLVPGFNGPDANLLLDMIGVYRAAKSELDEKRLVIEQIELTLPPDYRPELDLVRRVRGLLYDYRKATGQAKPEPEVPDLTGVPADVSFVHREWPPTETK